MYPGELRKTLLDILGFAAAGATGVGVLVFSQHPLSSSLVYRHKWHNSCNFFVLIVLIFLTIHVFTYPFTRSLGRLLVCLLSL